MANEENPTKSTPEKDDDNFFIRNIHLLIAVFWGLCALGLYFYK